MILHKLFQRLRRPQTTDSATSGHGDAPAHRQPASVLPVPQLDCDEVQTAIAQHIAWCKLFNEHLSADPDSHPVPAELPTADSSELGRWIASINHQAASLHPLLMELERENRQMHRIALQALDFAQAHRMDLASHLLNRDFERSRLRVLAILHRLAQG